MKVKDIISNVWISIKETITLRRLARWLLATVIFSLFLLVVALAIVIVVSVVELAFGFPISLTEVALNTLSLWIGMIELVATVAAVMAAGLILGAIACLLFYASISLL